MMGIEGSVYIRFVIDSQGAVTDVEVIKGINGALDKEAMRVTALMPRWKPGRQQQFARECADGIADQVSTWSNKIADNRYRKKD